MQIYNTLTRKKELFQPRDPAGKKIQMFVCGPTVYDYIHIGNARTFVFFDVVAKYLKYKYGDENVRYIQNITDIDNKIIERAVKEGVDPLEYAKKYGDIFKQDMKALGVTSPEYKNATDHIPEVIKQVQALLDKGNAYMIENDGIYFDLATFPDYGKLSGRTAGMADDAVSRIDDSDKKRNRGDFAIWKFSKPGEPGWKTEFEKEGQAKGQQKTISALGRPGWHIEDTAITEKHFGPQYDIHGGGQDLMFPHHEAEIAQQESASGLKPFVKYWMHSGFLINKDEKMSKSLGNFETANELLKKYPKEVLRFYLLSAHYHSPLDFSDKSLKAAEAATQRLCELWNKLAIFKFKSNDDDQKFAEFISGAWEKIKKDMDNDFDTPAALAELFTFSSVMNGMIDNQIIGPKTAVKIQQTIKSANEIFGIIPTTKIEISDEVAQLVEMRETARNAKDFTTADQLREQIKILGHEVEDTVYGPLVVKTPPLERSGL